VTTSAGVANFGEILSESDGCVIPRAYLAIQSAVEDVVRVQFEMVS
jgi:pyruvate kinase